MNELKYNAIIHFFTFRGPLINAERSDRKNAFVCSQIFA